MLIIFINDEKAKNKWTSRMIMYCKSKFGILLNSTNLPYLKRLTLNVFQLPLFMISILGYMLRLTWIQATLYTMAQNSDAQGAYN